MSDTKSGHDWAGDWQALQRQYWTAWSDLTRNQAAPPLDAATPWHEGLEQWARMFGSAGKQSEAAERLMAGAKNYLTLMQSMLAFAAGRQAGDAATPAWLEAMRAGMPGVDPALLANLPIDAALLNNPMAKALRDISGQGVKSFEQLASGALPMLQHWQNEALLWLRAPAFGYAREHQEHYQKMALAFAEYQQASSRYNALILKSSQRSFEILEGKIAERAEPGRQIDSLRALYDLWVDSAEEAYAEIALSEEFRQVYGEVVNAQMRVRSQLQQEVERIGVDLGMPTRTELNSVHKRLHELRREVRATQDTRTAPADGRDAEIAAMRAEVEELRRLLVNAGSVPAAARKGDVIRTERRRSRAKRAAAKRTHVASRAVPATAAMPEPVARHAKQASNAASPASKRAPRRAPRAVRAPAPMPKASRTARVVPSASFGDAIAAMRRKLAVPSARNKSGAAARSLPSRSAPGAKPRGSKR